MKWNTLIYLGLIGLLLFTPDCSIFTNPSSDTEEALQVAWEYFEMDNYQMAYTKFESVLAMDAENIEAYDGLAWCSLLLNDIASAITDFETALAMGDTCLDTHAGLAGAYIAADEFESAISKANYVVDTNPNYSFEHKPQINYLDMHLILAMAYFHLGDFENSYQHILILDPNIRVDENNAQSWVYNQQQFDSYAEVLMAIIDDLDALYGIT